METINKMSSNNLLLIGIIIFVYAIFLFPTFLILKKRKPLYWLMLLFMTVEVVVINLFFLLLTFQSNFEEFFIALHMFGIFISSFLLLFFPLWLNKFMNKKNNKWEAYCLSYFFVGLVVCGQIGYTMLLIAWSASQIINIV